MLRAVRSKPQWTCPWWALPLACAWAPACGEALPDDVAGYEDCLQMNEAPLPQRDDDPHEGKKNVFACNVTCEQVDERPFPDGALIVKESIKDGQDHAWLVATARKSNGQWRWDEYTRNFASEDFARIVPSEGVCIDCHKKWQADDWIATAFDNAALIEDGEACPE